MIKQIVTIVLVISLSISFLLWIFTGENAGKSYFWSSFSIIIPNIVVVFLLSIFRKKVNVIWICAFLNKFISAMLLLSSVKYLQDPNWVAFLVGVIVTVCLPIFIVGLGQKYFKLTIKH